MLRRYGLSLALLAIITLGLGFWLSSGPLVSEASLISGLNLTANTPHQQNQTDNQITIPGGAVIGNGTVNLGVHDQGHLIAHPANVPVGITYIPSGNDGLAHGCWCEGWAIADTISGVEGWAGDHWGLSTNLTFVSTGGDAVTTYISTVDIGTTYQVTHDYRPSSSPDLYEVLVSVTNISANPVDVVYRRAMDWDVPPTAFNEIVTLVGTDSHPNVIEANTNGFTAPNPLLFPLSAASDGTYGPGDIGGAMDLAFGILNPGQTWSFTLYYGAASDIATAAAALASVGSTAYILAEPSASPVAQTFMFGYGDMLPHPPADMYSYTVKFVCGRPLDPKSLDFTPVRPGDYATEVNIYNYQAIEAHIEKRFIPVVFDGGAVGREPNVSGIRALDAIDLKANEATMDDCYRVSELLYGGPFFPMPLTIGFIEFLSPIELDVVAVYTTSDTTTTATGFPRSSPAMEVEYIQPKLVPAPCPPGTICR